MPELKQPQEAAEKTTEQPLTTKKKRAMLEYMAIMFAAAFLLVAISLLIKVIDMKGEMEAANTGARETSRCCRRIWTPPAPSPQSCRPSSTRPTPRPPRQRTSSRRPRPA